MDKKRQIKSLNKICIKCNLVCYTERFQQDFKNWTSDDNDIDKFIQGSQLSAHGDVEKALEWIPYSKFCDIEYIAKDKYRANWIDGSIINWNDVNQNWERKGQIVIVELRRLYNSKNITFEFIDKIDKPYGITQDPETENYLIVLDNKCKKCNYVCYTKCFQHNFTNWSSGSSDIDKFIQDSQLSAHDDAEETLEWIPYDRFYDIRYVEKDIYRANWIDGNILILNKWLTEIARINKNMIVELKKLNNLGSIKTESAYKIVKLYGITQDPETENYLIVLDNKCKKCNHICYTKHFQQNFKYWTSGNNDIDKFIQDSQLLAHGNVKKALEWIPYERFNNVEYVAKGGFSKVYKANWLDGNINYWDNENQHWKRGNQNMAVVLKSLNNSKNVTPEFINEIMLHNKVDDSYFIIKFYGITQDPETKNYMMVLDYANGGSLRNYLNTNYDELNWKIKINYLYNIASALESIHRNELIHRDLHIGNILKNNDVTLITDMGLCKPADYNSSKNTKNINVYGVLPYIAPEILRGQNYTKAADIYSFGIIMYEIISGLPPYHDTSHDNSLAMKICQGLRPMFKIKAPKLVLYLIKRCLDANSLNRPTAIEIRNKLWKLKLQKQIKEGVNDNLPICNISLASSSYETHSEAIYISRLLEFNNLPEPKNSDDYYEHDDNIISTKFSDSLKYNFLNENGNKIKA